MDNQTIYKSYLRQGTGGFAIIRKFYSRYVDVLVKAHYLIIDDVVHEIFVSLSKIDFNNVHNIEHYVMRAIKLQCWSILDKAIRLKMYVSKEEKFSAMDEVIHENISNAQHPTEQLAELEGIELFAQVNLFKAQLDRKEIQLLNLLIDEIERDEIAKHLELNINTLDTKIRRLRMKLAGYLKTLGYSYASLERFS